MLLLELNKVADTSQPSGQRRGTLRALVDRIKVNPLNPELFAGPGAATPLEACNCFIRIFSGAVEDDIRKKAIEAITLFATFLRLLANSCLGCRVLPRADFVDTIPLVFDGICHRILEAKETDYTVRTGEVRKRQKRNIGRNLPITADSHNNNPTSTSMAPFLCSTWLLPRRTRSCFSPFCATSSYAPVTLPRAVVCSPFSSKLSYACVERVLTRSRMTCARFGAPGMCG